MVGLDVMMMPSARDCASTLMPYAHQMTTVVTWLGLGLGLGLELANPNDSRHLLAECGDAAFVGREWPWSADGQRVRSAEEQCLNGQR